MIESLSFIAENHSKIDIKILALDVLAGVLEKDSQNASVKIISKFLNSGEDELIFAGIAAAGFLSKERRKTISLEISKLEIYNNRIKSAIQSFRKAEPFLGEQ